MLRSIACIVVTCAIATAQPRSDADRLFREGIQLFDAGQFAQACEKFEQSLARDPHAIGTLMNLGRCNEKLGKVATALARFQEAHDRAAGANAAVMRDTAQERIDALAPQVPVVVVRYAGPVLPGQKLVVDDVVIANDRARIQLDPGSHALVLTAPGRLPYQTTFDAAIARETVVELPVLQLPKAGTTVRIHESARRAVGRIGVVAGAGVVVVAGALALYAKHDYDRQFEDPPGPRVASCSSSDHGCNAAGQARVDRDRNLETAAAALAIVGLAAGAVGVGLWVTAPNERAIVTPAIAPHSAGLAFSARF